MTRDSVMKVYEADAIVGVHSNVGRCDSVTI